MHTICKYSWIVSHFVGQESPQKLIRMKVHVFSDSTLCVGVSNPDPSNNWATKNTDLSKPSIWLHFICHVQPGALTLDIEKRIQRYLNGQNPESFDEGIIFMSIFNDIEGTKNNTKTCLHLVFFILKKKAVLATQFQARALVLLEASVRKHVVERKF